MTWFHKLFGRFTAWRLRRQQLRQINKLLQAASSSDWAKVGESISLDIIDAMEHRRTWSAVPPDILGNHKESL